MKNEPIQEEIATFIKAGASLVEVVSYEKDRVSAFIHDVAKELDVDWFRWNCVNGLDIYDKKAKAFKKIDETLVDPVKMLERFRNPDEKGLFILEDFHTFMATNEQGLNRDIVTHLREITKMGRPNSGKCIILCQPIKQIPLELLKEMPVVEVPLPTKEILSVIF
nr:hypothetical protein [Candidatus Sigynarchaeota archaeon]